MGFDAEKYRLCVDGIQCGDSDTIAELALEDGEELQYMPVLRKRTKNQPVRRLTARMSSGEKFELKVNGITQIYSVVEEIAERMGKKREVLRVHFDGRTCSNRYTLDECDIDDDCPIKVYLEQRGC